MNVLDDRPGSGWIKVKNNDGAEGLAPRNYVVPADATGDLLIERYFFQLYLFLLLLLLIFYLFFLFVDIYILIIIIFFAKSILRNFQ